MTQSLPQEMVSDTRDALAHYYDFAYLATHTLIVRLRTVVGDDPTIAVKSLRKLLLDAIESLRPKSAPMDDLAWRPYLILQRRYIVGKDAEQVERELAIGARQRQRDERRAIKAVAMTLWSLTEPRLASGVATEDSLQQEISRAATEDRVFAIQEQVERAIGAVRPLAAQVGVTLTSHIASTPLLEGDPGLYRQLLVAALSFTIRATQAGALCVRVDRSAANTLCSLEAVPTGKMAPPDIESLPESLVALADANHSHLSLQTLEGGWRLGIATGPGTSCRTIAIIEDNEDVVNLISRFLAGHGYHVVAMRDSTTALERISEIRPDAILLDVMMGGTDGWEILQRLKSDVRLCPIPVAVCSVLDEPDLAASLGADGYLRKPIRPAQVLECLGKLLRRQRRLVAG
ncbi:MAG: response regulator transcription factor [Anaerolineae bacterium]